MTDVYYDITLEELNMYVSSSVGCSNVQYTKFLSRIKFYIDEYVLNLLGPNYKILLKSVDDDFKRFISNLTYISVIDSEDNLTNLALNDRITIAKWWFTAVTDYEKTIKYSMYKDVLYAYDLLVKHLLENALWRTCSMVERAIPYPIWNIRQLEFYYGNAINYNFFFNFIKRERHSVSELERMLGKDLMTRIMGWVRLGGNFDDSYYGLGEEIVGYVEKFIISLHDGDGNRKSCVMRDLLCYLDEHIDYVPEYSNSEAYLLRKRDVYENSQDDSVFFFG